MVSDYDNPKDPYSLYYTTYTLYNNFLFGMEQTRIFYIVRLQHPSFKANKSETFTKYANEKA